MCPVKGIAYALKEEIPHVKTQCISVTCDNVCASCLRFPSWEAFGGSRPSLIHTCDSAYKEAKSSRGAMDHACKTSADARIKLLKFSGWMLSEHNSPSAESNGMAD